MRLRQAILKKEELLRNFPRESMVVYVLVNIFAIIMITSFGMIYAGHWIGFILLALNARILILSPMYMYFCTPRLYELPIQEVNSTSH